MQVHLAPQGEGLQLERHSCCSYSSHLDWWIKSDHLIGSPYILEHREIHKGNQRNLLGKKQLCWVQRLSRSQQERQKEWAAWLLFASTLKIQNHLSQPFSLRCAMILYVTSLCFHAITSLWCSIRQAAETAQTQRRGEGAWWKRDKG